MKETNMAQREALAAVLDRVICDFLSEEKAVFLESFGLLYPDIKDMQ